MPTPDPPIARNPIPQGTPCALIYGGSFDPPHNAHLTLPPLVRDAIGADLVVYIPAGRSPFKSANPIATGEQRIEMLAAGLHNTDRVAIGTVELGDDTDQLAPPSYSVDTLELLHAERAGTQLRLLIGADQARSFHRWHKAERIIEIAPPAVMLRPGEGEAEALIEDLRTHWNASMIERWRTWLAPIDTTIDASSTEIRALLASDPMHPKLETMLHPGVRRVTDAYALYRDQN